MIALQNHRIAADPPRLLSIASELGFRDMVDVIGAAMTRSNVSYPKGECVVYLCILPRDCRPAQPTDLPWGTDLAFVLLPSTSADFGQRFCLAYNQRQIDNGIPERLWAMCITHTRSNRRHREKADAAAAELVRFIPLLKPCEIPVHSSFDSDHVAGGCNG